MHLLDTNIIVCLLNGEPTVLDALSRLGNVAIPTTVLGELYFGAMRSSLPEKNVARLEELAGHTPVISCDAETAREYGRIKSQLLGIGRPIPENDIWIAALALQHNATLVTRDGHFANVSNLKHESI